LFGSRRPRSVTLSRRLLLLSLPGDNGTASDGDVGRHSNGYEHKGKSFRRDERPVSFKHTHSFDLYGKLLTRRGR
jgi:hypothetical protein